VRLLFAVGTTSPSRHDAPINVPRASDNDSGASATSLTGQTATGVAWGAGGALAYQLFGLVVQTALTYLLTKAQYGAYAKTFALLTFAMLLQQVGFNEILLRRRKRLRLWRTTVFWFALTLGLTGTLLLLAAALPLGILYGDPDLTRLLLLVAAVPLIRSLLVLPSLDLVDAMRFRLHYGLMLANAVTTSSATLLLALSGLGAKSFVVAMLLAEPLYVAIMWRVARTRIVGGFRPSRWLPLARDLRLVWGSNTARWVRSSIDPLVLGLFASQSVVGLYFFAQSMLNQIFRVVTLNLSGVLLPALNRISADPQRQTAAFLRAARVLTLIGAPLCIGLGAIGPLFVRTFLDADKWKDLPPVLAVLGTGMVFRLLDEPVQSLISAQGRFRVGFRLSVGTGSLYVVFCLLGSASRTALGVAIAAGAYYCVAGPMMLTVAIRVGGGRLTDAVRVFAIPFLLAIAAIAPWLLADLLVPGHGRSRDAAVLAGIVTGSCFTYLALGRVVRPDGWQELISRIQDISPGRLRPLVGMLAGSPPHPSPLPVAQHAQQR
jgi:O-antigen/teichoic acid export membrane protein